MKIVDIEEKSELQIDVYCNTQKIFFNAEVKFSAFDAVFIAPIKEDGKMLDFNAGNLIIHTTVQMPGDQPVIFRDCVVKGVRYKDEVYHMITSTRMGAKLNRRSRYRIPLGYTGSVRIGSHKGIINVVIHDLSTSGFSFTCEKSRYDVIGDNVKLVFIDSHEDIKFTLNGEIVREQEWTEDRVLYGCVLEGSNNMIDYYIAKKQRQTVSLNPVMNKNIIDLK